MILLRNRYGVFGALSLTCLAHETPIVIHHEGFTLPKFVHPDWTDAGAGSASVTFLRINIDLSQ